MKNTQTDSPRQLIALKIYQWLKEWDKVRFDHRAHRRRPAPYFYVFKLSASELKKLTGIFRRTTTTGLLRSKDLGIQRRHDERRSHEIREFIHYGYPWSELSEAKRKSDRFEDLRKPGWLPTAIVVNILKPGDKRHGREVAPKDIIDVIDKNEKTTTIKLPKGSERSNWHPSQLYPIEVIDGQHRLWAFETQLKGANFELPVVAFHGLDISWQAYLFWSINIKPKKINASLAFDLYPLLRTENWLEKFEGHPIYRETRSQELTEALWVHPKSPWYHRINMLGEPGLKKAMVSQAAWIRSLMATFVKTWEGRRAGIGGLFGAQTGKNKEVLPWTSAQQTAFLIYTGQRLHDHIKKCKKPWAQILRKHVHNKRTERTESEEDSAFMGQYTLLNTDQGIRGFLYIVNDLCYIRADKLKLGNWNIEGHARATNIEAVNEVLSSLEKQPVAKYLDNMAKCLAQFDWRTSAAPELNENERTLKAAFRGSGGYKELRIHLLKHLISLGDDISKTARDVLKILGYEQ